MSARNRSSSVLKFLIAGLALAVTCGCPPSPIAGADDVSSGKTIRFVPLSPAEILRLGPEWTPVPKSELLRFLKQARQAKESPLGIQVQRVRYEATFAGDSLMGGQLTAKVKRLKSDAQWLELGDVNLAISDLRQKLLPLVWGTAADERIVARIIDDTDELTGSWSLKGERIGQHHRFDLRLIPATASRIQLDLPVGYRMEASLGVVSGPHAAKQSGRAVWDLVVSGGSSTQITVVPPETGNDRKPVVLLESDLAYVVRNDNLQIRLSVVPEVLRTAVRSLTFRLPKGVDVYSVNYGGNTPLAFTTKTAPGGRRLRVQFPDPLIGRGRAIIVQAVASIVIDQAWELPQIEPASTLFLPGQVHLRVAHPLQFQSISTTGLRQTTGLSRTENGETLSFSSRQAKSRVKLLLSLPRPKTECRMVTRIDPAGDRWRATSELSWTVRRGALYTVRCRIPSGWQLDTAHLVSTIPSEPDRIVDWTEQSTIKGVRRLKFDLPDGLPADGTVTLRISTFRPATARRRRLPLPIISPVGVHEFEAAIVLFPRIPGDSLPQIPKGYRRLSRSSIPEFVRDSGLWKAIKTSNGPMPTVLFTRSKSAGGRLTLGKPGPSFDAQCRTWFDRASRGAGQQIHMTVRPRKNPVESVVVFLSQKTVGLRWSRVGAGKASGDLAAKRLPAARLSDWKLPSSGELWEIRLLRPTATAFQFRTTLMTRESADRNVTIPFLPQARRMMGYIELDSETSSDVRTAGLFPLDSVSGKNRPQYNGASKAASLRVWRYRTAHAEMSFRSNNNNSVSTSARPSGLELWSVLSTAAGGRDVHRAVFRFAAAGPQSDFTFRLPKSADVTAVLLNGRSVNPIRDDDALTVESLPTGAENTVEIRYSAIATQGERTARNIVVPNCDEKDLTFRWRFALPPNLRSTGDPSTITIWPNAQQPGWRTRMFGPLARPAEFPVFNPFSEQTWRRLFEDSQSRSRSSQSSVESGWAPSGWVVHSAVGIELPRKLTLQVSDRNRCRLWAWIGLLICLSAGWGIRRAEFGGWKKLAVVWLGFCLAAACFISPEFAEIAGGCLVGSLISVVLPRRLIRRRVVQHDGTLDIPLGSTVSYPRMISTGMLLIGFGLVSLFGFPVFAQPKSPKTSVKSSGELDARAVVVPTERPGQNSGAPVVYAHRDLLISLRKRARNRRQPDSVLQHADYRIDLFSGRSADITATYDVAVVRSGESVTVLLPIQDAALCGADACRVNGRIQPVRLDPDGRGFLVDLIPRRIGTPKRCESRADMVAAIGLAGGMSVDRKTGTTNGPERHRIELCLRSRLGRIQKDDVLRFRIPRVVSNRLHLDVPDDGRAVDVAGLSGLVSSRNWFVRTLRGRLGAAREFGLRWGSGAAVTGVRTQAEAHVRGLADIGVAKRQIRFFVRYQITNGGMNSIIWTVPKQWVMRSVVSHESPARRLSYRFLNRNNGRDDRIQIDLPRTQTKTFALSAEFLVPVNDHRKPFRIVVPKLHAEQAGAGTVTGVLEKSFRFGVSASAELNLNVVPANQNVLRALEQNALSEFRTQFPESRAPVIGWEVKRPTVLKGRTTLKTSQRSVRQLQTGRMQSDRLEWTLAADVTVDTAPAYSHELQIDSRLTVDSVRVLEDGAPRLVRFTRSGNRIRFFLSDKTIGTQNVVVAAHMPLKLRMPLRLPDIRFTNSTLNSSRILLLRDPSIGISIVDRNGWELLGTAGLDRENGHEIPAAMFRLPEANKADKKAPIIRPLPRKSTLSVDRLTVISPFDQTQRTVSCTFERRDLLPANDYTIFLPDRIAKSAKIEGDNWELLQKDRTDTGEVWGIRLKAGNDKPPQLVMRFPVSLPNSARWKLPLPVLDSAELQRDIFVIRKGQDFLVASPDAKKTARSAIPDWMRKRLPSDSTAIYRGRTGTWTLARRVVESKQRIPLMETRVWDSGRGSQVGRTAVVIVGSRTGQIGFRRPSNLTLQRVQINGKSIAIDAARTETLKISVPPETVSRVVIDWKRKTTNDAWPIGDDHIRFPTPVEIPVTTSLIVIDAKRSLRGLTGTNGINSLAYALRRIEALLEIAGRNTSQVGISVWAAQSAMQSYRALQGFLRSRTAVEESALQRLTNIESSLRSLQGQFEKQGVSRVLTSEPTGDLLPIPFDTGEAGHLYFGEVETTGDEVVVPFWSVNQRLVMGLIAFALGLIILAGSRLLLRAELGDRLENWEPFSWVILGTLWWLFLIPSFVGLLFFSVAVARFVHHWQRRKSPQNVIRLHELSKSHERSSSQTQNA